MVPVEGRKWEGKERRNEYAKSQRATTTGMNRVAAVTKKLKKVKKQCRTEQRRVRPEEEEC